MRMEKGKSKHCFNQDVREHAKKCGVSMDLLASWMFMPTTKDLMNLLDSEELCEKDKNQIAMFIHCAALELKGACRKK